ncbi:MAG: hypothetical protein AUH85_17120 [Chloroflexi bacterium 13_1_40CM_4_68_4]|nr:MAG: hypothetical protein AUH85_17120 [Chloroflexi bacterium 13_1_40CM_4_68_4]
MHARALDAFLDGSNQPKRSDAYMKGRGLQKLAAGGLIALAFAGGVALAPNFITPAAAEIANNVAGQILGNRGPGGADVYTTAAAYLGISVADLRTELQAGKSLSDVAVEKGKTRDGLIAAITQAESQRIAQLVDQKGLGAAKPGGPGRANVTGDPLAAAATYLGISAADLRTKLQAQQTLAAIANATPNKNRAGLIAAIVADQTAKIDAAQTAGTITADQATQLKNGITDRITKLVDSTGPWGPGTRRSRR